MCWGLPAPGENTESLVTKDLMEEIDFVDLQPGDAIGLCGPGTLGDAGHIMLFLGFSPGLDIAEQVGGQLGPVFRTLKRIPSGYKAYRLVAPEPMPQEEDMLAGFIAEDKSGIALVCFGSFGVVWQNIVSGELVDTWKAAGLQHVKLPQGVTIGSLGVSQGQLLGALAPVPGGGAGGAVSGTFTGTVA